VTVVSQQLLLDISQLIWLKTLHKEMEDKRLSEMTSIRGVVILGAQLWLAVQQMPWT
jgi:hypothetical protein